MVHLGLEARRAADVGLRAAIAPDYSPQLGNVMKINAETLLCHMNEIEEYFDNRADSEDGSYGIPEPNKEMRLGVYTLTETIEVKGVAITNTIAKTRAARKR